MMTIAAPSVYAYDGRYEEEADALEELPPLEFPSELYSRGIEQGTLLQVYELFASSAPASSAPSEVVLIHGSQGTGKTALGHSLASLLENQSCYFVSGRFDAADSTNQAGISMALTDLVGQIMQQNQQALFHVRAAVSESIVDIEDILTLSTRVPNLLDLLRIDVKNRKSSPPYIASPRRLMPLLSCLLQILLAASIDRQLVLFLDDLHQASKPSIHLLQNLLMAPPPAQQHHHSSPASNNNNNNKGLLLMLAYCQEQVPWDSLLQNFLIRMKTSSHCTYVETNNLGVEHVDSVVQAILRHHHAHTETMSLSRLIFHKTHGNPHHVIEFLKMLQRERLLEYRNDNGNGGWNLMRIQAETDVTENVARNVSFHRLHSLVQDVLKLAACLGKRFSASVLTKIAVTELLEQQHPNQPLSSTTATIATTSDQDDELSIVLLGQDEGAIRKIDLVLKIACEEGVLEHAAKGELKFTHERVRQSLLLFIPKDKRPFLHLRIGRHLRARMEVDNNMDLVFQAVDQFNRAEHILRRREDVIDLCRLNFTAGCKAFSNKSSFQEGVEFLEIAVNIAAQWDLWKYDYDLALDIFCTCARYEAYVGHLDRSHQLINVVLEKAKNLADKMPAYFTKMEILAIEEYAQDAIDLGLDLLEKLNERMPRKPNTSDHVKEFLSVSLQLRRHEDMLSLVRIHDAGKLAVMKILRLLCQFTFILQEDNLFPLVCLRSMSLTLQWGISPCAASAVASYAVVLGIRQDARSVRFGRLALAIHERYSDTEDEGFLLLLLGRFVCHWRQSMRTQIDMFERAIVSASDCKQVFVASMTAYYHLEVAFLLGKRLGDLQRGAASLSRSLANQSNEVVKGAALPLLQLLSCLQRTDGNTKSLSGALLDENKFSVDCRARGNDIARCNLYYYQIAHAFFFQNWQKAVNLYDSFQSEHRQLYKTFKTHFLYPPLLLHVGVAHYALAKSSSLHTKHAKRILRELSQFTVGLTDDGRQATASVCVAVLEAEHAVLHRNGVNNEESCYSLLETAMSTCRNNQLLQYEAVVAARASTLLDDQSKVQLYRARARLLYEQWGYVVESVDHKFEE